MEHAIPALILAALIVVGGVTLAGVMAEAAESPVQR